MNFIKFVCLRKELSTFNHFEISRFNDILQNIQYQIYRLFNTKFTGYSIPMLYIFHFTKLLPSCKKIYCVSKRAFILRVKSSVLLRFRPWTVTEHWTNHHVCILGLQSFGMHAALQQSTECNIPENFNI